MEAPRPVQVGNGEAGVNEVDGLSTREAEGKDCEGDQEKESQAHIDALMISHLQKAQQRESFTPPVDMLPSCKVFGLTCRAVMMVLLNFTGEVST